MTMALSTQLGAGPQVAAYLVRTDQADARVLALYDAYESGDYGIVERTVTSLQALPSSDSLKSVTTSWRGDWRPARATFLLEMAVAASRVGSLLDLEAMLSVGGTYALSRPLSSVGASNQNSYEILWHRTALALLEDWSARLPSVTGATNRYLDAVTKRQASSRGSQVDARALLARAIAAADGCCTTAALGQNSRGRSGDPGVLNGLERWASDIPLATDTEERVNTAVKLFDAAAARPETRSEALVRGALLLLHRNRAAQGLARLSSVRDESGDPVLNYWTHLVRGFVLDAMSRFDEAAVEYRAALASAPSAQSAGICLAVDLARQGKPDEAAAVALAVSTSHQQVDPWWTYDSADARFIADWLVDLRSFNR
jgi:tetratricopeptide (TPR) repeat protein